MALQDLANMTRRIATMNGLATKLFLAFALLGTGCHSMSTWRPSDGRAITAAEHRQMIHECRLEAQKGTLPIWRRSNDASCMVSRGWVRGEPNNAPASGPSAAAARSAGRSNPEAADDCSRRVRESLLNGSDSSATQRVLDGCLAEYGL